jgi:hypothetical protein
MNYTQNTLEEVVQRFEETLELEIASFIKQKQFRKFQMRRMGKLSQAFWVMYSMKIQKGAVFAGNDVYLEYLFHSCDRFKRAEKYTGSIYFPINNRDSVLP